MIRSSSEDQLLTCKFSNYSLLSSPKIEPEKQNPVLHSDFKLYLQFEFEFAVRTKNLSFEFLVQKYTNF